MKFHVSTEVNFYVDRRTKIWGKLYILPYNLEDQRVSDLEISLPAFCNKSVNVDRFKNNYLSFNCNSTDDFQIYVEYNLNIEGLSTYGENLDLFLNSSKYVDVERFKIETKYSTIDELIDLILKMIKERIKYSKEVDVKSASAIFYNLGYGKCVNYSHVALGFFRANKVPARYVIGITPFSNTEAHAWIEIWNGERWIGIDPTAGVKNIKYVKWAIGRDDHDVKSKIFHTEKIDITNYFRIKKI